MLMMPSIYGENLFDDFFNDFPFFDNRELKKMEKELYGRKASHIMKTDVKEVDGGFEMEMDLPGFAKDEVKISLDNGYLTIEAAKGLDKEQKEEDSSHYIRKERYAGACSRSFYVGDQITESDVKAEFKHGILKLTIPKKEKDLEVPEKKYIAIEG